VLLFDIAARTLLTSIAVAEVSELVEETELIASTLFLKTPSRNLQPLDP